MPKMVAALIAAVTLMVTLGLPSQARAQEPYPWCAQFNGDQGDGGTNCGFVSRAQCMASVFGVGGYCYENPAYGLPARPPRKPVKTR